MHIGIDARLYGLDNAGIGRYIINLVRHLSRIDKHNSYTLFLRPRYVRTLKLPSRWRKVSTTIPHYSLAEQTKFPKLIAKAKIDLMHFPHFNVPLLYDKPFIVTIHDLLWHKTKGLSVTSLSPIKYALKYFGYRAVVHHAIAKANHIIVPSNFVKNDLVERFDVANKITVTHESIDDNLLKVRPELFSKLSKSLKIDSDFIVYTGSAYPHKNVIKLIDAVDVYLRQSHHPIKLVIISSRSIFLDKIRQHIRNRRLTRSVILTGFLTDSQVKALYQNAKALVHPSLSEGFGLTGLEAMALGLPVIASNAGSLPEIYGEAALYINPHDQIDIADKIRQLINQPTLASDLRLAGLKQVKQYSWDTMAQTTLNLYEATKV